MPHSRRGNSSTLRPASPGGFSAITVGGFSVDKHTCPICGEEAVVEGPAPNTDEEEGIDVQEQDNEEDEGGAGEEGDEEDEEPPRRPGKSSRRTSPDW